MKAFSKFIKEIEDFTGEEFDYTNRRHRFHLKEKVNRLEGQFSRMKSNIDNVLNGFETFDPSQKKAIIRSDRVR